MLNSYSSTIEYLSVKEVAELTGLNIRMLQRRCNTNKYVSRIVDGVRGGNKGKSYEILVSSLEVELQEKIYKAGLDNVNVDCHENQRFLCGNELETNSRSRMENGKLSEFHNDKFDIHKLNSGGKSQNDLVLKNAPLSLDFSSTYYRGNTTDVNSGCESDFHNSLLVDKKPLKISPVSLVNNVSPNNINTTNVPAVISQPVTPIAIPEKAKQIALAKVDVLGLWEGHCHGQKNKRKASEEFVKNFNSKFVSVRLFTLLNKISVASLYRWKKDYEESGKDFYSLISNYNYGSEFQIQTSLTDREKEEFLKIMLHPNQFDVGHARRLVKSALEAEGIEIKSLSSYRRFMDKYKATHKDIWTFMREGKKALKDKVAPHIIRDWESQEVGDCFVADGNELDCQVINPFTGKPTRAVFVAYMDEYSWYIAGWELMITENTQSITSALRNAVINLGKAPKMVYLDNGRAFKGNFFTGLKQSGIKGIYEKLGIETQFAEPYNGRAKLIERFFKEFTSTFPKIFDSYVGNCIANKPAYMKRNEKFHKDMNSGYIPTVQEVKMCLEQWLEWYHSTTICSNDKTKTIKEVFESGKGAGVDENLLDDLMMATEIRQIQRNGVSLFGNWYHSMEMYGKDKKVLVKYSFSDISYVKIYSLKGEFICVAPMKELCKPHAMILGNEKDLYTMQKQRKMHKKAIATTIKKCEVIAANQLDKLCRVEYRQIECKGVNKEVKSDAEDITVSEEPNNLSYFSGYSDLIKEEEKQEFDPFKMYGNG